MLKHDSIEDKEEYKEIFQKVKIEVGKMLNDKGVKRGLGYIHIFESHKKKILKEKYGIEWKTTQEMNQDIRID